MTSDQLHSLVHNYWLMACLDRRRLRYYSLSREDQVRVSFDKQTRADLLAAVDEMPARLAEHVILESGGW